MQKRILCLLAVLLLVGTVAFAQAPTNFSTFKPTKTITIQLMAYGAPTKPVVNDVVKPVIREKTKVIAEVYDPPTSFASKEAALMAMVAGNNLPDVITGHEWPPQVSFLRAGLEADAFWDFSDEAQLRKLFPNFTKRLDQWGDFKNWYANETTVGDTHYRITQLIPTRALTKLVAKYKSNPNWIVNIGGATGSQMYYFRDDILKQIFPTARSNAEQEKFYVEKFNAATPTNPDPYSDIPIKSMDDMFNYLKKVKELVARKNLKDGTGKDAVIPAQLQSGMINSLKFSMQGFYGYLWSEPPFRVADKLNYPWAEPWWYDVLKWWSKVYHEGGILDPEVFIKQPSKINEDATRGLYAVFQEWLPVGAARQYATDNKLPYSFRASNGWFPAGQFKAPYNDLSNAWTTYFQHYGANIVTKNVKEEDLAQVCNWLDYHYSEEADVLRSWGPSTFYTGTGAARRFKPEYKDLENFQVNGTIKAGAKDGTYYGIYLASPAPVDAGMVDYEVSLGSFFNAVFPEAPRFVYPQTKKYGQNYDSVMHTAWHMYYENAKINFFPQVGWTNSDINAIPGFSDLQYTAIDGPNEWELKCITGDPADFDANWALIQKWYKDKNYNEVLAEMNLKWKSIFDKNIKQYWK